MIPIADNHAHTNPIRGLGPREVAKRFRRTGGWFMGVVSLLTWDLDLAPGNMDHVDKLYRITVESVELIRQEGVKALAIVGLHPAECVRLIEAGWSIGKVREFVFRAIDLAGEYVRKGWAAGIGEVGRPHWPVSSSVVDLCNETILYAMQMAKDLDAVIHLHLERMGKETVDSIAMLSKKAGIDPQRVILHHASPDMVMPGVANGLTPSIPAGRRGELEEAVKLSSSIVVESDYIDDPRRPGAVIPPWRILSRVNSLIQRGIISNEVAWRIMVDNIAKIYPVKYG